MAAVPHYNVLPRLLAVLANRYLGIPMVGHFDDFAAIIRKVMGKEPLNVSTLFCALLGFQLKDGKSHVGPDIVFLGPLGHFPCLANGWKLPISLPGEKRAHRPALPSTYLKEGMIPHRCLGKLIGRLSFSQTAIFGKFARTQLRPMRQKFRRRFFSATLSPYERSVSRWRKEVVSEFTPRIAAPRARRPRWIIYTGAATNHPMLCALLFRGGRSSPDLHTACAARAPAIWPYFFRHAALIYGLELLDPVLSIDDHAAFLNGSCCWVYLCNNNFLETLIRGDSNTGIIAILVSRFWQLVQRFDICVWFSRVHLDLNPADPPLLVRSSPSVLDFGRVFPLFDPCRPAAGRP